MYINEYNREKVWLRDGPEFEEIEENKFIIQKALYGIKSTGSSFRLLIDRKLDKMRFNLCCRYRYREEATGET